MYPLSPYVEQAQVDYQELREELVEEAKLLAA